MTETTRTTLIGRFEGEATKQSVDGQPVTALWTDGVMLSADNGKTDLMPGVAPHAFTLQAGCTYKVTVERIESASEPITPDMINQAKKVLDEKQAHYGKLCDDYAKQLCPFSIGQRAPKGTLDTHQKFDAVVESIKLAQRHGGEYCWTVRARLLTQTGRERKQKEVSLFFQSEYEKAQAKNNES